MVTVLLEQDVTFGVVAEVLPVTVLAVGDQSVEHLIIALVFDDLDPIEPMFDMIAAHLDPGGVPAVLVKRSGGLVGRNQIVE